MKWTKKDVIQAIITLTDPFESAPENPLEAFRKAISSPVPQLPSLPVSNNGNK